MYNVYTCTLGNLPAFQQGRQSDAGIVVVVVGNVVQQRLNHHSFVFFRRAEEREGKRRKERERKRKVGVEAIRERLFFIVFIIVFSVCFVVGFIWVLRCVLRCVLHMCFIRVLYCISLTRTNDSNDCLTIHSPNGTRRFLSEEKPRSPTTH
jgi:hypothetical protein